MGRKYTNAQKIATANYQKKLSSISIRVKPEEADRYRKAAECLGISQREFILAAMNEKIERDCKEEMK